RPTRLGRGLGDLDLSPSPPLGAASRDSPATPTRQRIAANASARRRQPARTSKFADGKRREFSADRARPFVMSTADQPLPAPESREERIRRLATLCTLDRLHLQLEFSSTASSEETPGG